MPTKMNKKTTKTIAPRKAVAAKQFAIKQPLVTTYTKRSPEAIVALMERFVSCVKKNPDLRMEQLNQILGTTTKDLQLPVRQLVAAGRIKTKGEKRGTTYFPGRKA